MPEQQTRNTYVTISVCRTVPERGIRYDKVNKCTQNNACAHDRPKPVHLEQYQRLHA